MATRKQIRNRIVALMSAEMAGTGNVLAEALGPVGDWGGASPVALVGSDGSTLQKPASLAARPVVHRFRVQALVKYAEIDASGALVLDDDGVAVWTDEQAANTLDDINDAMQAFWQSHKSDAGYWISVDYPADTAIEIVDAGGVVYLRETYTIALTCN